MDIIQQFNNLPPLITIKQKDKSYTFELQLISNGPGDVRLTYYACYGDFEDGSWLNPYIHPGEDYLCSFLFLVQYIEDETDMDSAIIKCKLFLQEHGLG